LTVLRPVALVVGVALLLVERVVLGAASLPVLLVLLGLGTARLGKAEKMGKRGRARDRREFHQRSHGREDQARLSNSSRKAASGAITPSARPRATPTWPRQVAAWVPRTAFAENPRLRATAATKS
jgi:hypothetical protein